jgi:hypothetical protein
MANRSYSGGCQCGAVRFTVEADLDKTITCNCSRCRPLGMILAFAPESAFDLRQGEGALSEYRFNQRKIAHLFCATCGVQSFGKAAGPDGVPMVAINARCLDGVDLADLSPKPVDGRSF